MKKSSSRGSAMLAVLVFITLVLILGAGILTLADAAVKQSRALSMSDNVFYSAESALQVYVQIVDERVRAVDILSDPEEIALSELDNEYVLDAWRSDHLTYIKDQLFDIYKDVKPAEGGNLGITIHFYIGDERIFIDNPIHSDDELAMIGDSRELIIEAYEGIVDEDPELEDSEAEIWTEVVFYPTKAIRYIITAELGGRTLVASVGGVFSLNPGEAEGESGAGDARPNVGGTVFTRPEGGREGREEILQFGSYDGGAYYKNNNTNVYQALKKNADGSYAKNGSNYVWETIAATEKQQAYDGLIAQLKYVISETNELTRDSVLGNIPADDTRWSNGVNQNATHIRVTGNYTLSGSYPNLVYMEVVNGNLTIATGAVNCPKLRGVYVGGGTGTEAITISENSQFTGNGAVGGTVFLTKGRDIKLNMGSSTTRLIDGKFLASGGDVTIYVSGGGSGNNESNSMFVATKDGNANKGKLTTDGQNFRMAAYSTAQVPQYYAENDLILKAQNSQASFEGIFATLSDNYIFKNASPNNGNLRGIFVGNCGGILGTSVRILPFNPAQEDKMLPGGLFDADGDGTIIIIGEEEIEPEDGSLKIKINDITFDGTAKLVIRETTGDRP